MAKRPDRKRPELAEYRKIEIDLRRQIASGRWAAGVMMPSRRDLARQYSVSLLTVTRAIEPLLADGTLRTDNRRGTFVAARLAAGVGAGPLVASPLVASPLTASDDASDRRPVGSASARAVQGTIAVVTFFFSTNDQEYVILHALEQICAGDGSVLHVVNRAHGDSAPALGLPEAVETALRDRPDGLIITALDRDIRLIEEDLGEVSLRGVPAVCILPGEISRPIPHVFYDNRSGGYQAMQHLIDRGIIEFTVVAPFTASWVTERITGIRAAAAHAGLSPGAIRVIVGDGHPWTNWEDPRPVGCRAVRAEMEAGWTPSGGILCVSDGIAFGTIDAAAERGLRPGKDFAILGFDDHFAARANGLTSVRPPMTAMAREAARLLHDHRQGIDASLQVRLRAQVIPRMSSGIERIRDLTPGSTRDLVPGTSPS